MPGVVRTEILDNAGRHGQMLRPIDPETHRRLWQRLRPLDPDTFAKRALRQVARNRAIIVVPTRWRLLWWLNRLSPALGDRVSARLFETTLREFFPNTGNDSEPS